MISIDLLQFCLPIVTCTQPSLVPRPNPLMRKVERKISVFWFPDPMCLRVWVPDCAVPILSTTCDISRDNCDTSCDDLYTSCDNCSDIARQLSYIARQLSTSRDNPVDNRSYGTPFVTKLIWSPRKLTWSPCELTRSHVSLHGHRVSFMCTSPLVFTHYTVQFTHQTSIVWCHKPESLGLQKC